MNTLAVAPPNSCGGYIRYERLEDERQETKPFVLFQYVYLASVYREERICVTSKGLRDIGQLEGDDDHDMMTTVMMGRLGRHHVPEGGSSLVPMDVEHTHSTKCKVTQIARNAVDQRSIH